MTTRIGYIIAQPGGAIYATGRTAGEALAEAVGMSDSPEPTWPKTRSRVSEARASLRSLRAFWGPRADPDHSEFSQAANWTLSHVEHALSLLQGDGPVRDCETRPVVPSRENMLSEKP
jgi:hypothetical protein